MAKKKPISAQDLLRAKANQFTDHIAHEQTILQKITGGNKSTSSNVVPLPTNEQPEENKIKTRTEKDTGQTPDRDRIGIGQRQDKEGTNTEPTQDKNRIDNRSGPDGDQINIGPTYNRERSDTKTTPDKNKTETKPTHDGEMTNTGSAPEEDKTEIESTSDKDQIDIESTAEEDKMDTESSSTLDRSKIEPASISDQSKLDVGLKHHMDTGQTPDKKEPASPPDRHNIIQLTEKRYLIYNWFIERGYEGAYIASDITTTLNVSLSLVRRTLEVFRKARILTDEYKPDLYYSVYAINRNIMVKGPAMKDKRNWTDTRSTPDRHTSNKVSSSVIKNTNLLEKITRVFETNPEFEIWKKRKLPPEKIIKWIEEFNCSIDDVLESMCHKVHQLQKNNFKDDKGEDIGNLENYFYKSFEKSHGYISPDSDYKSHEAKEAERLENQLKQKREALNKLKKLREEEALIDAELEFENIIQNQSPDNEKLSTLIDTLFSEKSKKAIRSSIKAGKKLKSDQIKRLLSAHLKQYRGEPGE